MDNTTPSIPSSVFKWHGEHMLCQANDTSHVVATRRFRALFGTDPETCSVLCGYVRETILQKGRPVHLLWALMFLKNYSTEHVNVAIAKTDENTFRKWNWKFVTQLRDLDSRYRRAPPLERCCISVDGVDFPILEPKPFGTKWYSHKFKGAGLRYELRVSTGGGDIVWIHGPFSCGAFPDLKIFRLGLKNMLNIMEWAISDQGYSDEKCKTIDDFEGVERDLYKKVRGRHEKVNGRMKQFSVLGHWFRHHLLLHLQCFMAVANILRIMISNGEPIFNV